LGFKFQTIIEQLLENNLYELHWNFEDKERIGQDFNLYLNLNFSKFDNSGSLLINVTQILLI